MLIPGMPYNVLNYLLELCGSLCPMPSIGPFIQFIHSFACSFVHTFMHSLIHPSVHSSIRSFIHLSFIHSFTRLTWEIYSETNSRADRQTTSQPMHISILCAQALGDCVNGRTIDQILIGWILRMDCADRPSAVGSGLAQSAARAFCHLRPHPGTIGASRYWGNCLTLRSCQCLWIESGRGGDGCQTVARTQVRDWVRLETGRLAQFP